MDVAYDPGREDVWHTVWTLHVPTHHQLTGAGTAGRVWLPGMVHLRHSVITGKLKKMFFFS